MSLLTIVVASLLIAAPASLEEIKAEFYKNNKIEKRKKKTRSKKPKPPPKYALTYNKLYKKAYKKVGQEVGRNIVVDGYNPKNKSPRPSTKSEVLEGINALDRILNPPPPPPEPTIPTTTTTQSSSVQPSYSGGNYSIPDYIVQCESGGDYNAANPSGAYGAYQIMPGTAAAYGCDLSTPAGQDACAAKIYAAEGASPWVCG